MPLISVLMPVYNAELYVAEAIESLLKQTITDFELIILNDASTDNSPQIIEKYAEKDKRITLFQAENNLGASGSKNFLLQKISGEYAAWLDADDIAIRNRFERQLQMFRDKKHIDILGSWGYRLESSKRKKMFPKPCGNQNIVFDTLLWCPIIQSSSFFKSHLISTYNLEYDEKIESSVDYDFWVKAAAHAQFENIATPLVYYRKHSQQISTAHKIKQQFWYFEIVQKHLSRFSIAPDRETLQAFLLPNAKTETSPLLQEKIEHLLHQLFTLKDVYNYSTPPQYFVIKCLRQYYKSQRKNLSGCLRFTRKYGLKNVLKVKFFPTQERQLLY